jgi:hypothetical protein
MSDNCIVLNPATGRMVSTNGAIGKKLQRAMGVIPEVKRGRKAGTKKEKSYKEGVYNPATGRMVSTKGAKGKKLQKAMGVGTPNKQVMIQDKEINAVNTIKAMLKRYSTPQQTKKIEETVPVVRVKAPRKKKETAMTYEGAVRQLRARIEKAKFPKKKAELQRQLDMMLAS